MKWVSQQPRKPDGPPRLRFCDEAGWRVESFDLAAQIAHIHANVLKAVRAAGRDNPDLLAEGDILYSTYRGFRRSGRILPCCLLSRDALIATFDHLRSVPPACPNIRAVLDTYLKLFDEPDDEPEEDGIVPASAIPDPEWPAPKPLRGIAGREPPVEPSKWLKAFRQSDRYREINPASAPDTAIAPADAEEARRLRLVEAAARRYVELTRTPNGTRAVTVRMVVAALEDVKQALDGYASFVNAQTTSENGEEWR